MIEGGRRRDNLRRRMRCAKQAREVFLDRLAEDADVGAAAAAAGLAEADVRALRRCDATFAEGWGAALVLGYQMLETRLLAVALGNGAAGGDGVAGGAAGGAATMPNLDLALKLVTQRREARGAPAAGRRAAGAAAVPTYASAEETEKALMRKLAAIEKRRRATAA